MLRHLDAHEQAAVRSTLDAEMLCRGDLARDEVLAYGGETAFKRHMREIEATFDSIRPK